MKIIAGMFRRQPPSGLATELRKMADSVDRGAIVDLCAVFVEDGNYNYVWAASLFDSVALTSMLHAKAIDRMRQ